MRLNEAQRALIGLVGLVMFFAAVWLKIEHDLWQPSALVCGIAFLLLLTARKRGVQLDRSEGLMAGESTLDSAHGAECVNAETVRITLAAALDHWEKANCDCCAPNVLEEGIDRIGYDLAYWKRLRHFGLELAMTAQNLIDNERQESPPSPSSEGTQ